LARRIDRDFNERITKNEFCDALLPNDVSRENIEIRTAQFLEKSPDYFYNPVKNATATKYPDQQLTEKRKYLAQNINLINQAYDNIFSSGEDELKHIRPYFLKQEDVMEFANENFYKTKSVKPMNSAVHEEDHTLPRSLSPDKGHKKNKKILLDALPLAQTLNYRPDHMMHSQKNRLNTSLRNSKKRIFDDYNLTISPTKKDAEMLKSSMHEINAGSMRYSSFKQSNHFNNSPHNSKLAHLFQHK